MFQIGQFSSEDEMQQLPGSAVRHDLFPKSISVDNNFQKQIR
jgi:hypothetical protein